MAERPSISSVDSEGSREVGPAGSKSGGEGDEKMSAEAQRAAAGDVSTTYGPSAWQAASKLQTANRAESCSFLNDAPSHPSIMSCEDRHIDTPCIEWAWNHLVNTTV